MTGSLARQALGLVGLFLTLASCDPLPQAGGGIGGTGSVAVVSSGPVTKFGSVFVSGTEYDNSKTIYCLDDEPCSSANKLKLGMIVLVDGWVTEDYSTNQPLVRVADRITFEETAEGVVQSVANDGLSLVVLGQVIHLNQNTVIDASISESSAGKIEPGNLVEVSGFVMDDGHILATFISLHSGTPHYEVQGTIKHHDFQARRFEIGALEIHYDDLADTSRMPTDQTWNGLVVHIRGDQWSQGGSGPYGAKLTAARVKPIGIGVEDGTEAEVEGFILRANAPGDFFVNNLHVQTTPSTVFEGGSVNDLVAGAHLEIHGYLAGGALQAERISYKGEVELASSVASIDPASRSFTLSGLTGLTVYVNSKTAIGGVRNLTSFEDIRTGDYLKIHGRTSGAGIVATELERGGQATEVKIEGPVRSVSTPTLTIASAAIDTSGIADDRFIGSGGTIIGRSAFFQGLAAGHKISLKGIWTGSGVTWTSARRKT